MASSHPNRPLDWGVCKMNQWDDILESIASEIEVCDMSIAKWESRKQAWRDIGLMIEEKAGCDELKGD